MQASLLTYRYSCRCCDGCGLQACTCIAYEYQNTSEGFVLPGARVRHILKLEAHCSTFFLTGHAANWNFPIVSRNPLQLKTIARVGTVLTGCLPVWFPPLQQL